MFFKKRFLLLYALNTWQIYATTDKLFDHPPRVNTRQIYAIMDKYTANFSMDELLDRYS